MLDTRLLYSPSFLSHRRVVFHTVAMAHVCKNSDGSQMNDTRTALGYQVLDLNGISGSHIDKYVFARSPSGCEIHVHHRTSFWDMWAYAVSRGVATVTGFTGQVLAFVADRANVIKADVAGKINAGEQVFCGGHGIGGAVAALVAELLKKDGVNVRNSYHSACANWCTDAFCDAMQVTHYNWNPDYDVASDSPPGITSFAALYQPQTPPFPPLRRPGSGLNGSGGDGRLRESSIRGFSRDDAAFWVPNVTPSMELTHRTDVYLYELWRSFYTWERAPFIPWQNAMLNTWNRDLNNLAQVAG